MPSSEGRHLPGHVPPSQQYIRDELRQRLKFPRPHPEPRHLLRPHPEPAGVPEPPVLRERNLHNVFFQTLPELKAAIREFFCYIAGVKNRVIARVT